MAAAAPSPAEAAFRELFHSNPTAGARPFRGAGAAASAAPAKQQQQQQQQHHQQHQQHQQHQHEQKPEMTLSQQIEVLRDGASTAGMRKSALTALRAWVEQRGWAGRHGTVPSDGAADGGDDECQRVFQENFSTVLKCFADPSEGCREQAVHAFGGFIRCGVDVAPSFPLLFAALSMRLPAGLNHDPAAGVFVYDAAVHDAHQRGKAISRQDKNLHQHASPSVSEPSEAVRIASLQLLCTLLLPTSADTHERADGALQVHFHDAILFVQYHLRDSCPDVRIEACQLLTNVAQAPAYELGVKIHGTALFRALLPSLRHQLARVRTAALTAVGAIVAVPDRAKCRSVGAAVMEELVGFRADNVLSVAAFYRPEVHLNHLAELVRDPQASVRLRLLEVLEAWLLRLPDRRAHDTRLVPYLLTLLNDPIQRIQERAFATIVACGELHLAEERVRREEQQQPQRQAHEADVMAEAELESSRPWPSPIISSFISSLLHPALIASRPPVGARLFVRSATRRALPVVAEELAHWTPATRLHSAQLLRLLILFHERAILPELPTVVPAIVRGLLLEEGQRNLGREGEGDGGGAAPILLSCAAWLGAFINGIADEESAGAFADMVECLLSQECGLSSVSAEKQRVAEAVRAAIRLNPGAGLA